VSAAGLQVGAPPVTYSGPELLFGVENVERSGSGIRASMPVGAWLADPAGVIGPGALGVLADDVLGYAILAHRSGEGWSVSTEITIDLLAAVPASATRVYAEAAALQIGHHGAYSTGRVHDEDGRLLAQCSQRARFIPPLDADPGPDPGCALVAGREAGNLYQLLGAEVAGDDEATDISVEVNHALANPRGNLHGGVAIALSELAANRALARTDGPSLAPSSLRICYARPVRAGATMHVRPAVTYRGRSLASVEVTCWAGGKARTIAQLTAEPDA
jgi:uncharacterized protein (TIGR00369 family)